ncbi:MAG TPA: OadG family protein [Anaerovoracaceae bacterium]|nr:OadG family protein [Anaerovoracaceae bacterium]
MSAGQAISLTEIPGISLVCLLLMFAAMLLFLRAHRKKDADLDEAKAEIPDMAASEDENDDELIAVIAAAIQCYEQEKKRKPSSIYLARNFKS